MQKLLNSSILNKKRTKWGIFILAFAMAFGATFGFLGRAKALPGDPNYWTTTSLEDDLSITVVSVSQNGRELVPTWDDSKNEYYFTTSNSTDTVIVGAIVDGMTSEDTYYYYENDQDWEHRTSLSPEDNGQTIIYEELHPHIYFSDNDNCTEYCDPFSGEYYVGASINRGGGWYGVQKNIMLRPSSVGSRNLEIVSVTQNNTPLTLTNNEFQITDYAAPVKVTYKLKNLEVGKRYSVNVGYYDYYQFEATTTEVTETRELGLEYTDKHLNSTISLYSASGYNEGEYVTLYFKIADDDFIPLGNIIIDSIEQGGVVLPLEADTSGWRREYTFTANDAQGIDVRMHATEATASMNYYLRFNMYGERGGGYSSDEPVMVTGEELAQQGIVFTIPPAFGQSDSSPFTLSLSVTTSPSGGSYGSQTLIYQEPTPYQSSSDGFYFNFYEDENVPRFDASIFYSDGRRVDSDTINPLYHDANHPLVLEVRGEGYDNSRTYTVTGKIKKNRGAYYERTFAATGAQLNEGTTFELEGLTLTLPEFDASGDTTGYEVYYTFSLEINGLLQSGDMLYAHDGWINTLITYDGGEVAAVGSGGGIGGSMYMTSSGVTVRRTSLDTSNGAVMHYIGERFDENLTYDYTLYYNGDVAEDWWSAPAGTIIDEGTLTGRELNSGEYSWTIAEPSNESKGLLYTMLITINDGMVIVSRDYVGFTEAPIAESFKFTADSDSFMQTGRQSYRVARNTDITATLTGSGFDDEEEYRLWISYEGYKNGEENEYGYSSPDDVDLTSLNHSVLVSGAALNSGYTFGLSYHDEFDETDFMYVGLALSDKDGEEPDPWRGEEGYSGHNIHIEYVNEEDVFHGDGYQVNEDGGIVDVSEPEEPHYDIPVDDRTSEDVNVIVEGGTLTVVSETPVVVIGFRNDEWVRLYEWDVVENGEERTNHYSIGDCDEVKVVLKGDGDMDGAVSTGDTNLINRSLISTSLRPYRPLSDLERIILDVDGDGTITTGDSNLINRSLISPSLRPYKPIAW